MKEFLKCYPAGLAHGVPAIDDTGVVILPVSAHLTNSQLHLTMGIGGGHTSLLGFWSRLI